MRQFDQDESFMRLFRRLCHKYPHKEAYRIAEKRHKQLSGERRYKNYHSFQTSRKYRTTRSNRAL